MFLDLSFSLTLLDRLSVCREALLALFRQPGVERCLGGTGGNPAVLQVHA